MTPRRPAPPGSAGQRLCSEAEGRGSVGAHPRHQARGPREENTAAGRLQLSAEVLARLSSLPPAVGDTHREAGTRMLER